MTKRVRTISIRQKILLAFSLISLASTVAFTVFTFLLQRQDIVGGIDEKLRIAALSIPEILPQGFHDRVTGSNSISRAEQLHNVKLLTDFARRCGVTFLYSFVKESGHVYFTSTSGTEEQFASGTTLPFYEPYEEPTPALLALFDGGKNILVESDQDEFGNFRSVLIPIHAANGKTFVVGADIYVDELRKRLARTLVLCVGIGLASFLAVLLISISMSRRISKPIVHLADHAYRLGSSDFVPQKETEADLAAMAAGTGDEVGSLARAFLHMLKKLEEYIRNLKETTAAKERIESELKIAHDIQMSFLPKIFPPFPNRTEFDLYAAIVPAKEVGGDLYDFCLLDDEHLFFYVGDVSDKGVPAALFMAVTMTLMKRTAQQKGVDPAAILRQVNVDLSGENENLLFVTLFCAILNFKTGELCYSNAGHNPPVVVRKNGEGEWLKLPDGLVLGVMPDSAYENRSIRICSGDAVLLYTDGVTEAMNPARKLYSEELLMKTGRALSGKTATEAVKTIMDSVRQHAAGAAQSDDITVMALTFKGA